jgi:hypothetical protein
VPDNSTNKTRAEARVELHYRTASMAVLVALLISFYMLFMAAAAGSAGLRVAAA